MRYFAPASLGVFAIDSIHDTLRTVFGFGGLRPVQEPILQAILAGRDVLAVLPTGGGKSLCYQLPGAHRDGLVVVVSPLLALMREQVTALRAMGIAAASLSSANDWQENRRVENALAKGELRLLYLAPERLTREDTLDLLAQIKPWLLAVDEAHCVVEWGHDFRQEYRQIALLGARLPQMQVLALTATADQATRTDICTNLFKRAPEIFVASFDRPNLHLAMAPKQNARRQIVELALRHKGESGIVYCASRNRTGQVVEWLADAGLSAVAYHAGMETAEREAAQDRFLREDDLIVCATVAFGMGIDKPDVRFVAHADMPKTVESYWQEIGRAGRDGAPASTLTLYGLDDIMLRRRQIDDSVADDMKKRADRQRLNALLALCESPRCRRQTLLAYFGETCDPCNNCDLCRTPPKRIDGTTSARKMLSAMARTGQRFGAEHLIAILRGEKTERVVQLGHDALPTFGVGVEHDARQWRSILRQLAAAGHVQPDASGFGGLALTESGRALMRGEIGFEMREDAAIAGKKRDKKATASAAEASVNQELLEALKTMRRELAAGNPLYTVFTNRTLVEMAEHAPVTAAQLRAIYGVGEAKLRTYGEAFLNVIREWKRRQ
jgi:ATP-dependent DNA helicase RecQ